MTRETLKRETERMLAAVQDLTIRMNNRRKAKLRSDDSSASCGMCKVCWLLRRSRLSSGLTAEKKQRKSRNKLFVQDAQKADETVSHIVVFEGSKPAQAEYK